MKVNLLEWYNCLQLFVILNVLMVPVLRTTLVHAHKDSVEMGAKLQVSCQ